MKWQTAEINKTCIPKIVFWTKIIKYKVKVHIMYCDINFHAQILQFGFKYYELLKKKNVQFF